MNLLTDPWIPVRADNGTGEFRLLSLEELLCEDKAWWVSIPRDDLEMACIQLLICMVQVMLMPQEAEKRAADKALLDRIKKPLSLAAFNDLVANFKRLDWFNLDHVQHPFMQKRGVRASKITPIQKLLVGLPEGNNHAFFNEVGEVRHISGSIAAIALFNQASNTQSIGRGLKGNLRGGTNPFLAPITSLVVGNNLRETVWRNILTVPRLIEWLGREQGISRDEPPWISSIAEKQQGADIGLARGLFWQPVRLELIRTDREAPCDLLGEVLCRGYTGFKMEQSKFKVEGLWPHLHGVRVRVKGQDKFASFSAENPSWTYLSEFLVPNPWSDDAREGSIPAAPVSQAADLWRDQRTQIMVGGYCTRMSSVTERRHDIFSLAEGWSKDRPLIKELVTLGKDVRTALRTALLVAARGYENKRRNIKIKGIGTFHKKDKKLIGLHDIGDRVFYARTESLFHEVVGRTETFKDRQIAKKKFAQLITKKAADIYKDLTDPYSMNPAVIPIIAWGRSRLNEDLSKLTGGAKP